MNRVKFSAEYLCKFLPHFKDLRELEVTYSAFNNCCLHTVGVYCRNLVYTIHLLLGYFLACFDLSPPFLPDFRKLNLIGCHEITDDGIEALCGGESELGKEMPLGKSGQSKSIQELLINGTQVTHKGVEMALRHLPHLKKFDDWHVVQTLAAMHSHQTNLNLPEYSLTDLNVFCYFSLPNPKLFVPYKTGDLPLAASLCPFVTSVNIDCAVGINDSDILGLMGLKHLNKLTIVASRPTREITFDGGLVPILKVAGRSLKFLALRHFRLFDQSVRLAFLVEHCPNLEDLSLVNCKYSLSTGVEEGKVSDEVMSGRANKRMKTDFAWKHLKKLSLEGVVGYEGFVVDIPTEALLLALSLSPALEELTISRCLTFDDDFVHLVFECHSFASLKSLHLYFCHAITIRGIRLFRNIGMDWNHLSICHCNSVKIDDDDLEDEENIDI